MSGHDVFFLTCDGGLSNCYSRTLKGSSKFVECSKCILGGIRTYPVRHVTSIHSSNGKMDTATLDRIALSSSCTLNRTESEAEWHDPIVVETKKSLHAPILDTYQSAMRWIEDNQLAAIICFNGRMDITRAVTYACEQSGIPFVTHERTWFGDGLQLIPKDNCLSISALNEMVKEFANKPLTEPQARLAGKLVGERFTQQNSLEWRLYNKNSESVGWPLGDSKPRVLVLPSSKNEFAGHREWVSGWGDNTKAIDDLFEAFSIKPEQVVVRCHPNWAENIGQIDGNRSLTLYQAWAAKRRFHCVSSEHRASTYDLIQQADIVVMNGGSSAVEAGVCGKQVICLGPATYQEAGFVRTFCDRESLYRPDALRPLDPDMVIRRTLRFLYLRSNRFPQYVNYVRALETTRYTYFDGADPQRLVDMLKTGKVSADDRTYASDLMAEDQVVDKIKSKKWGLLADYVVLKPELQSLKLGRRFGLGWVDSIRARLPRGDRG